MKNLKISKEISLPIDAVTQTLAAIGRKGAGKTYLATMIAEQMLDAKAQVIVIDPVGNWWGLRVGSDGKSKGKEIFVIGGDHGDVPLVPEAGARIARLIVEKNVSAILDVSGFRIGEHKRFAADFAEEFFHLKKSHKGPVHIFIEEAQKIIPQRVGPDEARMVGAFEQIVRLGRNYGIGATLITQRPQSVNKEVLSQVECLCVLQITGPHERKALEEWVHESGADRKLVGELPGLARGEGYVWSPSWLRIYQRVHFSSKSTFDASATPEIGKVTRAASLSAVDVAALRKDMADVVDQAEKDNPKVLRKRIGELEQELKKNPHKVRVEIVEKLVLKDTQIEKLGKIAESQIQFGRELLEEVKRIKTQPIGLATEKVRPTPDDAPMKLAGHADYTYMQKEPMDIGTTQTPLSKGARSVLSYLHMVSPYSRTKAQIWVATGYAPGGGFNNILYELTAPGFIQKDGGTNYSVTGNYPESTILESFDPSLEKWYPKLSKGAGKIMRFLLERSDSEFSKEEIASATEYAIGGGFNNLIYELTGKELICKVGSMYTFNPKMLEL